MAGQRKLMSEIDRTLKKVSEGVDVFNEIWDKVYAATNQAQKEKHEADLKKEIKKLQRFRDQIKTWISNSDVKDKRPLVDTRKLIEQKMEEFKVCEKETKTKAYSKEGLAQTERLDPAEAARQKSHGWIQDCLTQFNEQIEAVECDLERLQSAKGRNRNKSEMERLEQTLAKHKWHVLKLEQINRLLDNDALEPSQVDELKEDVDYYLEANQVGCNFVPCAKYCGVTERGQCCRSPTLWKRMVMTISTRRWIWTRLALPCRLRSPPSRILVSTMQPVRLKRPATTRQVLAERVPRRRRKGLLRQTQLLASVVLAQLSRLN